LLLHQAGNLACRLEPHQVPGTGLAIQRELQRRPMFDVDFDRLPPGNLGRRPLVFPKHARRGAASQGTCTTSEELAATQQVVVGNCAKSIVRRLPILKLKHVFAESYVGQLVFRDPASWATLFNVHHPGIPLLPPVSGEAISCS
jgi:hypothetical protein